MGLRSNGKGGSNSRMSKGVRFEGSVWLVKEQVAQFFEVTPLTIEKLLQRHGDELNKNGQEVMKGKRLKAFKFCIQDQSASEVDFVAKTTVLGIIEKRGPTQTPKGANHIEARLVLGRAKQ